MYKTIKCNSHWPLVDRAELTEHLKESAIFHFLLINVLQRYDIVDTILYSNTHINKKKQLKQQTRKQDHISN